MTQRRQVQLLSRVAIFGFVSMLAAQGCGDGSSSTAPPPPIDGGSGAGGGHALDAAAGGKQQGGGGSTSAGGTHARPDGGRGQPPNCDPGSAQCVGDSILEICSPVGEYVAVPCGAGERCDMGDGADGPGRCVAQQGTPACTPGEKKCATDGAAKVCDNDGSGWVVSLCADGKVCKAGDCVVDVKADCEPGSTQCVGGKTSLRCQNDGHGFEATDCPASAPCRNGLCTGSVCALGQTTCSPGTNAVRTCVDGTHFTETPCSVNAFCRQSQRGAVCSTGGSCSFQGQRVCGDPSDPSVSQAAAYSECTIQSDGSLAFARVDCVAPATCDPSNAACSAQCVPGEKRCSGAAGFQQCTPEGTWGAIQVCNAAGTTGLACRPKAGVSLPDTECVDEACANLSLSPTLEGGVGFPTPGSGSPSEGVCDGAKIRRCSADGHLGAAADCAAGTCRVESAAVVSGLHPGSCTKACADGESRCVQDGFPLFTTCGADGTFSSAFQSCGSACRTDLDTSGHRIALCGDACVPGSTRCSGDQMQTCGSNGKWLAATACSVGRCATDGGQALCRADCVPGQTTCVGATKTASDGASLGSSASAVCTSKGLLPTTTTTCSGTTTCRTSSTGDVAGCVECVGPNVRGGNADGLVDSRCSTDAKGVQVCGADNGWQTATSCGTGACFVGRQKSCEPCTEALPDGSACTQSALQARFGGSFVTCNSFGFGPAASCGGTTDCCGGHCATGSSAFAFCAPSGFSPCLGGASTLDLPNTLPQTLTGSALFGKDTLSPSCGSGRSLPDDVYAFTAPKSGSFEFDTLGSSTDTVLFVLDPLACDELACNDDLQGQIASRVFVNLAAGQKILIVVESTGDYTLHAAAPSSTAACGNGVMEGKEQCDGKDLNGQTCLSATLGSRSSGTLKCTPSCAFDVSGCTGGPPEGGLGTGGGSVTVRDK